MSVQPPRSARAQRLLVAGALLLLALLGCNRGLWTPDEPREAEISREMLLSPAVIPTLNGERFVEKPPLYYWLVAAVFHATGGATVWAARAVSVAAGLATLLALYLWLSRAHGRSTGLLAVCMLGSSLQFVLSTHWVLIDPLLMLVMTLAAWAAWELISVRDSLAVLCLFYLAMLAALWIKGLIGPVLMGAGLLAWWGIDRPQHWRRLRPLLAMTLLLLSVGSLALALYAQGGRDALWEWGYVNHVKRLLSPGNTGHRQPLIYYVWTLPYTLLPWLLPLLWSLQPSLWRRPAGPPQVDVARYGAIMSAAMLLVLSLSATKRETYLLPLLPLLFAWLAVRTREWWQGWQASRSAAGAAWWSEVVLLSCWCLAAPIAGIVWTRSVSVMLAAALLVALAVVLSLWVCTWQNRRPAAAASALTAAVTGAALLLALAPPLLNATKDLAPFMRAMAIRLPPGAAVVARNVDETLAAEVPFYTGRTLSVQGASERDLPPWLLVQDNHDGSNVQVAPAYRLQLSQSFGSRRTLRLWHLQAPAPNSGPSQ